MAPFPSRVVLGRTGLQVSPIGVGSSYGIGGLDLASAFDRGVNLFYWGSLRRRHFARGLRPLLRGHRDQVVLVVQSYARFGLPLRLSLESALRRLRTSHADLLLLGWWNRPLPERLLEEATTLIGRGLARHVLVSGHQRSTFVDHARDARVGSLMIRYNAAHPGAERDVFPSLSAARPGVIAYTATCWGWLLDERRLPATDPRPSAADCYRFALTHPSVDACFCGPRDGHELAEALAAMDRGPMSIEEATWMKRVGSRLRQGSLVPWQG